MSGARPCSTVTRTWSAQSTSSARWDQTSAAMASRITTVSTLVTTCFTTHTATRASSTAPATVHKLAFRAVSRSNPLIPTTVRPRARAGGDSRPAP